MVGFGVIHAKGVDKVISGHTDRFVFPKGHGDSPCTRGSAGRPARSTGAQLLRHVHASTAPGRPSAAPGVRQHLRWRHLQVAGAVHRLQPAPAAAVVPVADQRGRRPDVLGLFVSLSGGIQSHCSPLGGVTVLGMLGGAPQRFRGRFAHGAPHRAPRLPVTQRTTTTNRAAHRRMSGQSEGVSPSTGEPHLCCP